MADKYFTGARAIFYYNGQYIGYARGISGTEEYTMEPINVLGRLETVDYAPTSYRVQFRCRFFRLVDPANFEIKRDGNSILPNDVNKIWDKIAENVEVVILDRDGNIKMRLIHCVPASRNWEVDSRGVWGEDVQFHAIYVRDNE